MLLTLPTDGLRIESGLTRLGLGALVVLGFEQGRMAIAVDALGDVQNSVGTLQNRLTFAISLAQSQIVNTKAAESRIRDVDMAEEMVTMTKYQILQQAGTSMLAQANQSSQTALKLLQ